MADNNIHRHPAHSNRTLSCRGKVGNQAKHPLLHLRLVDIMDTCLDVSINYPSLGYEMVMPKPGISHLIARMRG